MTGMVDRDFFDTFERRPVVRESVYIDPLAKDAIRDHFTVPLVESGSSPLVRPTRIHGRNFEDPQGVVFNTEPIHDEFGNYYSDYSIKGADATYPAARFSEIEPSNVRVNGMLDASTFTRCRDVSRALRAQGVLVEWPIYHARPKLFPDGEGDVGLLEFKYMIYDAYVEMQRAYQQAAPSRVEAIGKAGAVGLGLLDMQFGVMYRAMLSNIRLAELPHLQRHGTLDDRVTQGIYALQQRDLSEFDTGELVYGLDPAKSSDRIEYLTTALPSIMGQNLALFQRHAYHKYLHPANWSIAGEIVDLDSVRLPSVFPDDAIEATAGNKLAEAFEARHALDEVAECVGDDPEKLVGIFNEAYRSHTDSSSFTRLERLALDAQTRDLQEYMDSVQHGHPQVLSMSLREAASLWYDVLESTFRTVEHTEEQELQLQDAASNRFLETLAERAAVDICTMIDREGVDTNDWLNVEYVAMFEAATLAKQVYASVEEFIDVMAERAQPQR